MSAPHLSLRYEPLERLRVARPVDRIPFVVAACRGRTVLDLGAMDETAFAAKRGRGTWMHEEIAKVATRVVGVDASADVPEDGLRTAPNAVIQRGDIMDLGSWLAARDFSPDVVIAGEIVEHLPNPLQFLRSLGACERLRGCELVLTTPNATALHNVLVGLLSRESTHKDHLCILSYKTLNTLCARAGFSGWEIIPYFARFTEMRVRHPGLVGALVGAGEAAINALECLFPLLSFGYIVRAQI